MSDWYETTLTLGRLKRLVDDLILDGYPVELPVVMEGCDCFNEACGRFDIKKWDGGPALFMYTNLPESVGRE